MQNLCKRTKEHHKGFCISFERVCERLFQLSFVFSGVHTESVMFYFYFSSPVLHLMFVLIGFLIKCMLAIISLVPVNASSLLQVEEMEGLGGALFLRGNRGVQRCPSTLSNHAQSVGELITFICAYVS